MKAFLACLICFLGLCHEGPAQQCGDRKLDPRISLFLKRIGYEDLSLEQLRLLPISKHKMTDLPAQPYPQADVQRIRITPDSIAVLVFNPLHRANLPIMIHYHGGGFIAPLVPMLEYLSWEDAKTYRAIVFAVDYRVAPEHPFPAAVDDSYNAFKWIAENGAQYGGDTSRIVLAGNSSGANLVAVIAQLAKKDGIGGKIKLQVMNGLPIDLRPSNIEHSVSYQENEKGFFHTKAATYFAIETYAPGQYDNPLVSPILNEDLAGLPPAVIINAEFDPFQDDGILYAARLRKAGVRVWDKCFAGQIHCLIGLPPGAEELREFASILKRAMKESFSFYDE